MPALLRSASLTGHVELARDAGLADAVRALLELTRQVLEASLGDTHGSTANDVR